MRTHFCNSNVYSGIGSGTGCLFYFDGNTGKIALHLGIIISSRIRKLTVIYLYHYFIWRVHASRAIVLL